MRDLCDTCANIECLRNGGTHLENCTYYLLEYYLSLDELSEINDLFRLRDLLSISRAVRFGQAEVTQKTEEDSITITIRRK